MSENREQICKVLTEEILGKCWHEVQKVYVNLGGVNTEVPMYKCLKCGDGSTSSDISWSNPRDFSDRNQLGELYNKIQEIGLWEEYYTWAIANIRIDDCFASTRAFWLFDPARVFDCVYPWWVGREK